MIVIGTAGHIDHGKSSIVKRITGTDPDRLPEEKKRGMTIDLGFAFYQTPDKDTIAFVDVPGHERFVKNMISGAGGIDAVMLVVAADDGWMPQTEEHFQIVRLLGVKYGLIVVNKSDLVDQQTISSLKREIGSKVKSTFLANAPIFEVSSTGGDGFDILTSHLNSMTRQVASGRDIEKPRLYIDRLFVRQGIGAVATGTLKDGRLSSGQTVTLWPSLLKAKIKSLQSSNQDVTTAQPAQRTAISLSGVSKEKIKRGDVITTLKNLDRLKSQKVLAANVELLKDSPISITNRREVLLLIGTTESLAEIRIVNNTQILPGESGILLIKTKEPVYSMIGDRMILRLPTPMITIGGGVILDHLAKFPRKKELYKFTYLESRDVFAPDKLLLSELQNKIVTKAEELLEFSNFSGKQIDEFLKKLIESGQCSYIGDYIVHTKLAEEITNQLLTKLAKKSAETNKSEGWLLKELIELSGIDSTKLTVLLSLLVREKKLEVANDKYFLRGQREQIAPEVEKEYEVILTGLNAEKFAPPSIDKLVTNGKPAKEAIRLLLKNNEVHKCGSEFLFTQSAWVDILKFIKTTISKNNELKVGELRDKFQITRKHAIPILEETDRLRITKRNGDVRIKGSAFEN